MRNTFWTLTLGGAFTAMPVWTVSQSAVQRFLAIRTYRDAKKYFVLFYVTVFVFCFCFFSCYLFTCYTSWLRLAGYEGANNSAFTKAALPSGQGV